jgi:hypothetical protein
MNRVFLLLAGALFIAPAATGEENAVIKLGMIGLDTSHVPAFADYINNPQNKTGCKVTAAFKGGSPDFPMSADRVDKFTDDLKAKHGVELVETIEALCGKVDGILLMSVDPRPHLKEAKIVIEAGRPLFIDKPMAADTGDVIEIFRLAKENNVGCWSSSGLRFSPNIAALRNNEEVGRVLGCAAYGSCTYQEGIPELYWYGVHGAEIIYSLMGTGCKTVTRASTKNYDLVTGVWDDGRIATYRGLRTGKQEFGVTVFGAKGIASTQNYEGYEGICKEVIAFFKTGKAPITPEETIELFAFLDAAEESKAKGGAPVSIDEIMKKARSKYGTKE